MPAERAGYTVTMFLVDVSQSMSKMREVEVPGTTEDGGTVTVEMTNLEWSLQYVMLKIQEMIFNGRKTDQCGVILFGTEDTNNVINEKSGGYENVTEFIPIGKPDAGTLAKISSIRPSEISGDPIDALIVGIETQHQYLVSKKTWTRKIILLTDGENPMEIEDWEATTKKMNALDISMSIIGVDFDDDELPFHEEDKSHIKHENEKFYHSFVAKLNEGVVGNCNVALQELAKPEIKQTKSALLGTVLRIGDVDGRPDEAIEILLKSSKCTALARPKSWKKFVKRRPKGQEEKEESQVDDDDDDDTQENGTTEFAQLHMRTEYYVDKGNAPPIKIEKEELIRGFKYGSSFAPCPDGQFPKLPTRRGIDICAFWKDSLHKREYPMGEVTYLWADPGSGREQIALSALVTAMFEASAFATARWVTRDGADPKMGVLKPSGDENVHYLLWVQMPFADDVRNFPFASLDTLVSKKGDLIKKHPYLPTDEQNEAMENFVDAMDLMKEGRDVDGNPEPWFDTRLSYNPAIHRVKQALFHSAVVPDLNTHPLPPPHPELLKYFEPPKRMLKRAADAIDECKSAFNVREVPKRVARVRKDGHVPAKEEDEEMLLLDALPQGSPSQSRTRSQMQVKSEATPSPRHEKREPKKEDSDGSATEPESDDDPVLPPTPRSVTPGYDAVRAPGRIIGTTNPLSDFRENLSRGDVVTKAVEDMAAVIKEIVLKPFATRRMDEMLECLQELRATSLIEDEVDAWNKFLPELRKACLEEEPGNPGFWARVQQLGLDIGLITESEGKKSGVSEAHAIEFMR